MQHHLGTTVINYGGHAAPASLFVANMKILYLNHTVFKHKKYPDDIRLNLPSVLFFQVCLLRRHSTIEYLNQKEHMGHKVACLKDFQKG